jgi:GAF domain-containing protein
MAVAMSTGRPLLFDSGAAVIDRFPSLADDILTAGREALVALPLLADGLPIGAIGLGFDAVRSFDEDERRFFDSLALQCAVALDRSRAYEAEAAARALAEAATRRLAFAAEAGSVLASSLDWERTIARVAELAVPRLADLCAISLDSGGVVEVVKVAHVDESRGEAILALYRAHPPRLSDDVGVGAVIRTGVEVLLPEVDDRVLRVIAADDDHLRALRSLGLTSLVVVPLHVGPARARGARPSAPSASAGSPSRTWRSAASWRPGPARPSPTPSSTGSGPTWPARCRRRSSPRPPRGSPASRSPAASSPAATPWRWEATSTTSSRPATGRGPGTSSSATSGGRGSRRPPSPAWRGPRCARPPSTSRRLLGCCAT